MSIKPADLHRALPLLGVLLLALAAWLAWSGWRQGASAALIEDVQAGRDRVAVSLRQRLDEQFARFEQRRRAVPVLEALAAGDQAAGARALTDGWPRAEAELLVPDLSPAFADPKAFGYGKLALLEAALDDNRAHQAVLRDGGEPRLGLAGPVGRDGELLALAYVRLPLATIAEPVAGVAPEGGYLALRYGRYTVVEAGDAALASRAEALAVPLGDSGLRVVAAAPQAEAGPFGLGGVPSYGAAAALAIAGMFLLLRAGRKPVAPAAAAGAAAGEPTLAQAVLRTPAATPVVRPRAAIGEGEGTTRDGGVALSRSIFRAYDIRGVVGQTLDPGIARLIGQAIGSLMQEKGLKEIVVGRDGRLSGPVLTDALIDGLRSAGRDVIDLGQAATPLVYFASFQLRAGSGVAVTGSHNPPDYNGFKIVVGSETLSGDAIQKLYTRIAESKLYKADTAGTLRRHEIAQEYLERIAGDVQLERKLRVVVDCGNGVAGAIAPQVLEAIGAEVTPLFCEVDGTFPNHHPDPSDPNNLVDLIRMVQRLNADIGLAFDGDGDRLGVVTRQGEVIYPDRLLMLFAADVLERNPGACILYDVKCTGHLATHILRHGGSPLMWKTGHSLIKAKMKETEAELAGEMSGHFFFKERWYGFDDGVYAGARLLEILAARPEPPEEVLEALPKGVSTPELKIAMAEGEHYAFIERFRNEAKFDGARLATIDGVRADWADGWGLVRASNTTPVLVLRFDADSPEALVRIQEAFRAQLLALRPDLALPF